VAPGADLYSIKVLGGNCSGRGDAFAAGLEWAIDEGMSVVNLSLGTTNRRYLKSFYELADRAYYEGCILVAAANNVPPPSIPSLCSSLISVDCDDFADDRSQFTFHPGRLIEIDAHGINVLAPWVNGSFRHVTGTSFAAPHVTGLVARLRAKHPELTPFQIKTVLCAIGRQTSTASNAIARGAGARTVRARRQSVAQKQQP
jgi:subtilisin family serine protease